MIEEYYRHVLRLVHRYPVPLGNFDPLRASNPQLAEYGLPERPDAQKEPDAFAFWQEMLNPPTVVVRPKFPGEEKDETFPVRAYRQIPSPRNGFGHRENSRNWSGAYITPHPRPNRFLQVAGAW